MVKILLSGDMYVVTRVFKIYTLLLKNMASAKVKVPNVKIIELSSNMKLAHIMNTKK